MAVLEGEYYIGTTLKLRINISATGFNQETNPYEIVASCGGKSITYTQEDVVWDYSDHSYYLYLDTALFKPGTLKLIITIKVPDGAPTLSGYRKEVAVKVIGPLKHP